MFVIGRSLERVQGMVKEVVHVIGAMSSRLTEQLGTSTDPQVSICRSLFHRRERPFLIEEFLFKGAFYPFEGSLFIIIRKCIFRRRCKLVYY